MTSSMVRLSMTRLFMTIDCGALDFRQCLNAIQGRLNVKVLMEPSAMVVKIDFLNTQFLMWWHKSAAAAPGTEAGAGDDVLRDLNIMKCGSRLLQSCLLQFPGLMAYWKPIAMRTRCSGALCAQLLEDKHPPRTTCHVLRRSANANNQIILGKEPPLLSSR